MESAAERKARLRALREAASEAEPEAGQAPADNGPAAAQADGSQPAQTEAAEAPKLKFRNYVALDESVEHVKVAPAAVPEFEEVKVDVDAVLGEDPEEVLLNVAPKKANWDLRRDIAPKLARLERRTQAAMIQLMMQQEEARQEPATEEQ